MPNNNFAGHARIHVRYTYIFLRATDGEESSKINDSVKFSARFRAEDATDQRSGVRRDEYRASCFIFHVFPFNVASAKFRSRKAVKFLDR